MARPAKHTQEMIEKAHQIVSGAKTARELRVGLSVTIPEACGVTNGATAKILGVGVASVVRMQKQVRDQVDGNSQTRGKWGGRRKEIMTVEQEKEFLAPWAAKAETGGVLIVTPIHAALEEKIGQKVAASTVYRILARHGWRKIEPDTCHPKRDPDAQESFKKTLPKRWMGLSGKTRRTFR